MIGYLETESTTLKLSAIQALIHDTCVTNLQVANSYAPNLREILELNLRM